MRLHLIATVLLLAFAFASAAQKQPYSDLSEVPDSLQYLLKFTDCDSLQSSIHFGDVEEINWPRKKPRSTEEALIQLAESPNVFAEHALKICVPIYFHRGLGMGLRNEWGLWSGSKLGDDLSDRFGLMHPDNKSDFLLNLNWFRLNNQSQEILLWYKSRYFHGDRPEAEFHLNNMQELVRFIDNMDSN